MAVKVARWKDRRIDWGAVAGTNSPRKPQDYLVVPDQPWLDGFCVAKGLIRQFCRDATGRGIYGGGTAHRRGTARWTFRLPSTLWRHHGTRRCEMSNWCLMKVRDPLQAPQSEMGLAPGGLMRQEIYEDAYGFDAWDTSTRSRCFVHILNSVQLLDVTGCEPPRKPPTAPGVH